MHLCYVSLREIRYPKNLAKLKGAAVRITGNKPEGKNTMKEKDIDKKKKKKKELESSHGTMRQIHSSILKMNSLKYFSLPFTLLEPFGAVIIMNSKVHLT